MHYMSMQQFDEKSSEDIKKKIDELIERGISAFRKTKLLKVIWSVLKEKILKRPILKISIFPSRTASISKIPSACTSRRSARSRS